MSARGDRIASDETVEHARLRLWLHLLLRTRHAERILRRRLRVETPLTLSQFDLLAALERAPAGLTMGELSERLLVSNANTTGMVNRLIREGYIVRWPVPTDRRMSNVGLTAAGRRVFRQAAVRHNAVVNEMLAGLGREDLASLIALLERFKQSVQRYRG